MCNDNLGVYDAQSTSTAISGRYDYDVHEQTGCSSIVEPTRCHGQHQGSCGLLNRPKKNVSVCQSSLTVSHLAWSALAYVIVNSVKI